jgi:hypothetical protein
MPMTFSGRRYNLLRFARPGCCPLCRTDSFRPPWLMSLWKDPKHANCLQFQRRAGDVAAARS